MNPPAAAGAEAMVDGMGSLGLYDPAPGGQRGRLLEDEAGEDSPIGLFGARAIQAVKNFSPQLLSPANSMETSEENSPRSPRDESSKMDRIASHMTSENPLGVRPRSALKRTEGQEPTGIERRTSSGGSAVHWDDIITTSSPEKSPELPPPSGVARKSHLHAQEWGGGVSPLGGVVPLTASKKQVKKNPFGEGGENSKHSLQINTGEETKSGSITAEGGAMSPIVQRQRALGDGKPPSLTAPMLSEALKAEGLAACEALAALSSDSVREEVRSLCRSEEFSMGSAIVEQGDPGRDIFFVGSGLCEAREDDVTLAQLPPGGFFGEIGLLEALNAG
eukprot:CAMPEP_0206249190 /NCGR_PEP_ID=MMETSP0047_2-20121206/20777_1 /ASSEMBLY_ACC=CAM_ASM_000192 /TAXON_ID=195065 /ORGANISM="Chroomonas mesostigmatica_cf, Strain CCMP1168" /LENGTH=333 /DNA_ID=CAMNT_0053674897 /DNA_START=20 /DNA_END=1017 /DNA_ORIENTATION=+